MALSSALVEQVDAVFADMDKPQHPGAARSSSSNHDEIVYSTCYGFADLETQRPITADSLFYLASISKRRNAGFEHPRNANWLCFRRSLISASEQLRVIPAPEVPARSDPAANPAAIGCRALIAGGRGRPFSLTQLRIRNGSSCP
jgi:hypothetical protein